MNIKLREHYWSRGSSWVVEIPCLDLISISGSLPDGFTSLTDRIINLAHPNVCEINIEVGDNGIFLISSSTP
jgi:hypothetical protein